MEGESPGLIGKTHSLEKEEAPPTCNGPTNGDGSGTAEEIPQTPCVAQSWKQSSRSATSPEGRTMHTGRNRSVLRGTSLLHSQLLDKLPPAESHSHTSLVGQTGAIGARERAVRLP